MKSEEVKNWNRLMEIYAPEMYEMIYAVGEKQALIQVEQLQPEIIMLPDNMKDALGLLIRIKQIHPKEVVFVMVGTVEDEQEVFDEFKAHGAYKCYTSPLSMDTLTHDMYVALNMEE